MSTLIDYRIGTSNLELIRDQIGAILATELANQAATYSDSDLNPLKVWNSRFVRFDKTEMSAVNVNYVHTDNMQYDSETNTNIHKYTIDVHTMAKSKAVSGDRGDVLSMWKMVKIMSMCAAILNDTRYSLLGFPAPSIFTQWIESMDLATPIGQEAGQDADSLVFGRIIFNVKTNDQAFLRPGDMIRGFDTQVKLDLTDKGYVYVGNNY